MTNKLSPVRPPPPAAASGNIRQPIDTGAARTDQRNATSNPDRSPGQIQVWPLPQLYSVEFSQSRISVKKCVFDKRIIKVCISCFCQCSGTSAPSTWCPCFSVVPEATHKVSQGPLVSAQKAPQTLRVRDRHEGVAGRNGGE